MKYKNSAYAILLFSGSLVCSEDIDNEKTSTSSDMRLEADSEGLKSVGEVLSKSSPSCFDNVKIGRQGLDKFSPGAPSFQQDDTKYNLGELMMFGAASFGWAMTLYYVACCPKK